MLMMQVAFSRHAVASWLISCWAIILSAGALWSLRAALVIASDIGIYYYLSIVFAMTAPTEINKTSETKLSLVAKIVICLLIFMTLYLGILPQQFIEYVGELSV